jgi:peroxiredoxin
LPDIDGRTVSLHEYRGRRVLLVFSDPHCALCDQLIPELVRLHRQSRQTGLSLVMIGRGEKEENRRKAVEHEITFPVVLQRDWQLSTEYGIFATPVAFLIGEDGRISKDVARGRDEILALAQDGMPVGEEAHVRVV